MFSCQSEEWVKYFLTRLLEQSSNCVVLAGEKIPKRQTNALESYTFFWIPNTQSFYSCSLYQRRQKELTPCRRTIWVYQTKTKSQIWHCFKTIRLQMVYITHWSRQSKRSTLILKMFLIAKPNSLIVWKLLKAVRLTCDSSLVKTCFLSPYRGYFWIFLAKYSLHPFLLVHNVFPQLWLSFKRSNLFRSFRNTRKKLTRHESVFMVRLYLSSPRCALLLRSTSSNEWF